VNGEGEEDEDAMSLEEKGDASARDLLGEGAATDPKSSLLLGGPKIKVDEVAGRVTDYRPTQRAHTAAQPTNSRPGRASTAEAYNLMRKWNLHFSGKRGNDAEAFLLRIKEARAIVPIIDADLFKCLPLFLSEVALYWVRLESENWRNWNDFEAAWRARFGDPDYQYALHDEIFRRTQGEHETAVDYLTCLRALLSRMTPPWPLEEQLNFAHRNMLPRMQIATDASSEISPL